MNIYRKRFPGQDVWWICGRHGTSGPDGRPCLNCLLDPLPEPLRESDRLIALAREMVELEAMYPNSEGA